MIYSMGTFAVICGTGLNRFIMGQGRAKEGMFSIAIGAVINIVLDPVFIFFLHICMRILGIGSMPFFAVLKPRLKRSIYMKMR